MAVLISHYLHVKHFNTLDLKYSVSSGSLSVLVLSSFNGSIISLCFSHAHMLWLSLLVVVALPPVWRGASLPWCAPPVNTHTLTPQWRWAPALFMLPHLTTNMTRSVDRWEQSEIFLPPPSISLGAAGQSVVHRLSSSRRALLLLLQLPEACSAPLLLILPQIYSGKQPCLASHLTWHG